MSGRGVVKTPDPLVQCVSFCTTPVLLSYKAMLFLIRVSKCHLISSPLSYPFVEELSPFLLPSL